MTHLHPCPACRRHVAASETVCPFCGARAGAAPALPRVAQTRMNRAAIFAGATILGVAAAGCDCSSGGDPEPEDSGMIAVDSGPAGMDSGPGGEDSGPAEVDAGPIATDSGPSDAGPIDTGFVPMPYGAPPARDRSV